ncbi:hypothetical protein [Candidatus Enterovibrio escicola]|uniref:hypothetical protein n=1 Tax=Candidatus Enterovibrio escicola TaxID=1927127 RepID=UPI00123831E2|nr:hypothetical protein [Candidatus Enterovibrio escacola]
MTGVIPWWYKGLPHHGKFYKIKMRSDEKVRIKNRIGIDKCLDIVDEETVFGHSKIDTAVGIVHKFFSLIVVETFIDIVNAIFNDF